MRNLEKFVIRDQPKPGELDGLRNSIEFMREELGMPPGDLPGSLDEARKVHEELKARVAPPTPAQLRRFDSLLVEVGGTFSGELNSRAQVDLLIRELEKAKREMGGGYHGIHAGLSTDKNPFKLDIAGILVALAILAIFWIAYSISEGFFLIALFISAFISLNLWFFGR